MLKMVDRSNRTREHVLLRSMFEERKRYFVDHLQWDLPVLAGRYEVDQFDDGHAMYLIVADRDDRHLASVRLLRTTRSTMIESLYPHLVGGKLPKGDDVLELSRFCLSRDVAVDRHREVRDMLMHGLVEFALDAGIRAYTTIAYPDQSEPIARLGGRCRRLGFVRDHHGGQFTALCIEIDGGTPPQLAARGDKIVPRHLSSRSRQRAAGRKASVSDAAAALRVRKR